MIKYLLDFSCMNRDDRLKWSLSEITGMNIIKTITKFFTSLTPNIQEGDRACQSLGKDWIYETPRRAIENEKIRKLLPDVEYSLNGV